MKFAAATTTTRNCHSRAHIHKRIRVPTSFSILFFDNPLDSASSLRSLFPHSLVSFPFTTPYLSSGKLTLQLAETKGLNQKKTLLDRGTIQPRVELHWKVHYPPPVYLGCSVVFSFVDAARLFFKERRGRSRVHGTGRKAAEMKMMI